MISTCEFLKVSKYQPLTWFLLSYVSPGVIIQNRRKRRKITKSMIYLKILLMHGLLGKFPATSEASNITKYSTSSSHFSSMISVSDIYYSQLVVAFDMKFVFMLWVKI